MSDDLSLYATNHYNPSLNATISTTDHFRFVFVFVVQDHMINTISTTTQHMRRWTPKILFAPKDWNSQGGETLVKTVVKG
jgi:hypothetical protein